MNPNDPDTRPPPRDVQPWTHVEGHLILKRRPRSFCICGWDNSGADPFAAADEHLRTAWPILISRLPGEDRHEWRQRIAEAHDEALRERERLWEQARMGEATRPGQAFQIAPDSLSQAEDRVAVLEQQLDEGPPRPRGLSGSAD